MIGLVVGTIVAGQTFYIFTLENLKQFGALKAIGVTNWRITGMILLQALMVGAIGYAIGIALTAGFFEITKTNLDMRGFMLPWQIAVFTGAVVLLIVIAASLAICAWGILDHLRRPLDDYRAAALYLAHQAPLQERIVASGYLYLEAFAQLGSRVVAFPPEQAQHPGWRATAAAGSGLPAGAFLWIGERAAPELLLIRRTRTVEPLFVNDRAMVARVR